MTDASDNPADPGDSLRSQLRISPWRPATAVLLAVALGVQAVATGVVVDRVDGTAVDAAIVAGVGVVLVVLVGAFWEQRIRERRRAALATAIAEHAAGGPIPDHDDTDPVVTAALGVVAQARATVARVRAEVAAAEAATASARAEGADVAEALRHEHERALRALRDQVDHSRTRLARGAEPSQLAVLDALATVAVDALDLELAGQLEVGLAPQVTTVEALLVDALAPLADVFGDRVDLVVDGEVADLGAEITVDVVRLGASLRTLAWSVVDVGADTLTARVERAGDEVSIRLEPVDAAAVGTVAVAACAGIVEASAGALELGVDDALITVPLAPWNDAPAGADPEALVDVVDEDDEVVGTATRAEIRAEGLRHRSVYVVVRTSDDGIVVHRRADWKDVYPGAWDLCFGGVVDAGESWEDAAVRELAEEAGIEAPLTLVGRGSWEGDGAAINGQVFVGIHDGPYPCPDGEVVEVRIVPRAEVADFLADRDHCTDSAALVLPRLASLEPIEPPVS